MKFTVFIILFASSCVAATSSSQVPQLPLAFEPNAGQTDSQVKYLAHASHAMVWLTERGAVLGFGNKAVRMRFEGANTHPKIAAEDRWPGVSNYYGGNDPSKWHAGVPHYGKVRYSAVYPGVNAVFYGNPTDLEYDFVVDPGADPSKIRLAFDGADSVAVDGDGALVLKAGEATIRNLQPSITQEGKHVSGRWVVHGKKSAGFVVENFDHAKKLTIDPILSYATYLGGSNYTSAVGGVAIDAQGNIIVGTSTSSTKFPLANAFDSSPLQESVGNLFPMTAFSKINPSASGSAQLVYSTYYSTAGQQFVGGTIQAVAVDSAGNGYFTGIGGDSLPIVNALPNQSTYQNNNECPAINTSELGPCYHGFVAEVSPTGTLLFSTYLGGNDTDEPFGLTVDAAGNIYVCGITLSIDFPLTSNFVQNSFSNPSGGAGFVTMISGPLTSRTIAYSTFLAGQQSIFVDSIAADGKGNIFVAGQVQGAGLPVSSNAYQSSYPGHFSAFAAILNSTGRPSLTYSTLLNGTDAASTAKAVLTDGTGAIIVGGATTSTTFPQTGAPQTISGEAGFVTKINPAAQGSAQVVYSGILGGTGTSVEALALDPAGHIWAGGNAGGIGTTANAFQPDAAVYIDGLSLLNTLFVAQLDLTQAPLQSVLYSSLLGGADTNWGGMALDTAGKTLVVGGGVDTVGQYSPTVAGLFGGAGGSITYAGNFSFLPGPPLTPSGYQTKYQGTLDGYIARFDLTQTGPLMTTIENGAGLGAQSELFLSPGLIFTIKGSGLGPASATGGTISNNTVTNNVAGVQVFVDGNPCPLLYLSATQINAIVPYETAAKVNAAGGGVVPVQVVYNGVPGNVIYMPVMATNPGLFSYDDGSGQGAILNQDSTRNGSSNPAARGSIAVFFATGEGQTNPPGVDGALATEPVGSIPAPVAKVSMTIGGVPVTNFPYIGTVPTGVAGALQIDATVPDTVVPGSAVPVVLTIGGNSSPNTLTMAIQ